MARLKFPSFHLVIGISLGFCLTFSHQVLAEVSKTEQSIVALSQVEDTVQISSLSQCIQGNGQAVTQTRPLEDFSAIKIDGIFTVTIELQEQKTLTIKGDENLLPYFLTRVEDRTLIVSAQGSICPKTPPEIRITNDTLAKLFADGATDIHVSNLNNKTFTVQLDGSSDLTLSGHSEKFTSLLVGANTLLAGELETQEASVTIDGSGEAVVHASRRLIAEINGAGDILYRGNPHDIERRINGAGDIEPQ